MKLQARGEGEPNIAVIFSLCRLPFSLEVKANPGEPLLQLPRRLPQTAGYQDAADFHILTCLRKSPPQSGRALCCYSFLSKELAAPQLGHLRGLQRPSFSSPHSLHTNTAIVFTPPCFSCPYNQGTSHRNRYCDPGLRIGAYASAIRFQQSPSFPGEHHLFYHSSGKKSDNGVEDFHHTGFGCRCGAIPESAFVP